MTRHCRWCGETIRLWWPSAYCTECRANLVYIDRQGAATRKATEAMRDIHRAEGLAPHWIRYHTLEYALKHWQTQGYPKP